MDLLANYEGSDSPSDSEQQVFEHSYNFVNASCFASPENECNKKCNDMDGVGVEVVHLKDSEHNEVLNIGSKRPSTNKRQYRSNSVNTDCIHTIRDGQLLESKQEKLIEIKNSLVSDELQSSDCKSNFTVSHKNNNSKCTSTECSKQARSFQMLHSKLEKHLDNTNSKPSHVKETVTDEMNKKHFTSPNRSKKSRSKSPIQKKSFKSSSKEKNSDSKSPRKRYSKSKSPENTKYINSKSLSKEYSNSKSSSQSGHSDYRLSSYKERYSPYDKKSNSPQAKKSTSTKNVRSPERSRDSHRSRLHENRRSRSRDSGKSRSHGNGRSKPHDNERSRLRENRRSRSRDNGHYHSSKCSSLEKLSHNHNSESTSQSSNTSPKYPTPFTIQLPRQALEQARKKKLLWSNKSNKEGDRSSSFNHWEQIAFTEDTDGKMAAKFKKLMGVKEGTTSIHQHTDNSQMVRQAELFSNLDQQYEMARISTHTQRGMGLGFSSQPLIPKP